MMAEPKPRSQNRGCIPAAPDAAGFGSPMMRVGTADTVQLAAFSGNLQPGLHCARQFRKFANPAPLGLCGFALTTFLLSLVNLQTQDITSPPIVIAPAIAYGGLAQFVAGVWEMAVGNTFGATALTSFGAFWFSFAIILMPSFGIADSYTPAEFNVAFGLFLMGWFIFSVLLTLCTMKATIIFFTLFCLIDLTFLMLGLSHLLTDNQGVAHRQFKAGGGFGIAAAFLAWYVAYAGIASTSNSFLTVLVFHFPWSEKARAARGKEKNNLESE